MTANKYAPKVQVSSATTVRLAQEGLDGLLAAAKTPVIVVAHPDDEALWCAGIVIRYPKKDWLIVCCTKPFKDPERADKFLDSCDVLGAKSFLVGFPERDGPIPKPDLSGRDLVISHGPNGEYGHPQHREVHRLVRPDVWFAYGDQADAYIALNDREYEQKLAAIYCYDHYSPADNGKRKSEALIAYYGQRYDLRREPYGISVARKDGSQAQGSPPS